TINPGGGNGEVQTDNNVVTAGFEIDSASASSASSVTSATPADPPAPPDPPTTSTVQPDPPTPTGTTSTPTPSPTPPPPGGDSTLVGFGTTTPGGSGQPIYTVTSLADSGPGTLRDAVSQGNRYVRFAVAGTITLSAAIETKGPFLTIDGLSAPAPGITLKGEGLYMMGYSSHDGFDNHSHDIIVRGLRVRDSDDDAFRVAYNAYNIVLDHVSALGAGDGSIDVTEGSHDVTVAWSIFADPASQLNSLLGYQAWHVSMHHNLFLGSSDRNPAAGYDYNGAWPPASQTTLEFWNNVVWDWGGGRGSLFWYHSQSNVINNYYDAPGADGDNTDALIVCSAAVPAANEGDCSSYDPTFYARAYVAGDVDPAGGGLKARGAGGGTGPVPRKAGGRQRASCRGAGV